MSTSKVTLSEQETYTVTGRQAAKALMRAYDTERKRGNRSVINLIGAPGNAKTSIVRQFTDNLRARRAEEGLGSVGLYSLRLNQADPTDLKGVPCFIEVDERQTCMFAAPEVFPLEGSPSSGKTDFCVIHLDELPQAPKSMQNLAANIIDGIIGDNVLDFDRTLIIVSGNRKQDNAATFDTPSNVKTRYTTLNVNLSYEEWKNWGIESGEISGVVLGFLENYHGQYFQHETPSALLTTYHNPRTWHKVSDFILSWDGTLVDWANDDITPAIISGTLGPGATSAFLNFIKTLDALDIEKVCKGMNPAFPEPDKMDVWYMACAEFAFRISQMGNTIASKINGSSTNPTPEMLSTAEREVLKNIGDWMLAAWKAGKSDVAFITLVHRMQSSNAVSYIRKITNNPSNSEFKSWKELMYILANVTNNRGK